ncbi:MAG: hypothetical protein JRH01_16985 [Deltaproteobacteria bacterium]|nr:hypothetical protein [Deltaproteobacteria bacterium]MBW2396352.1 hypothetical protein [Deltaproteobacteria bacterium]
MTAAHGDARAARERLHAAPRRELTITLTSLFCGLLLAAGWAVREEFYLTPERGLGYAFGILGLSCLVALLGYSVRKRSPGLTETGNVLSWFRVHMVLGIVGPTAILFHANFQLGSINSSVALWSMLLVAGSGYMGRFLYARVHRGLFGERRALAQLKRDAEEGFGVIERIAEIVPSLADDLDAHERWVFDRAPGLVAGVARFFTVGVRSRALKRRCITALRGSGREDLWFLENALENQLSIGVRVAQFGAWERLFSLWHAIHLPLAFLLFGAAAVHVLAVHLF